MLQLVPTPPLYSPSLLHPYDTLLASFRLLRPLQGVVGLCQLEGCQQHHLPVPVPTSTSLHLPLATISATTSTALHTSNTNCEGCP